MFLKNNRNAILVTMLLPLFFSGCAAPLILGGGAMVTTIAAKDKGFSGTASDSRIATVLDATLSNNDLGEVDTNVQNQEVLLTGTVKDQAMRQKAEELVWKVSGVKKVMNHIEIGEESGFADSTKDASISAEIRSKLLFSDKVRLRNLTIRTANSVVYILGVTQDNKEMQIACQKASKVKGVKKVVSYIKIQNQK